MFDMAVKFHNSDERTKDEMSPLERAILLAVHAHQGQRDKAGAPYVLHPLRVMLRMSSENEMIPAVLHDVLEDSDLTVMDLSNEGFSEEALEIVECLTRREGETYEEFIERVKLNPFATMIKLADIEDNMDMRRIREPGRRDWERLKRYHHAWLRLSC